jgi:hypothetical protein
MNKELAFRKTQTGNNNSEFRELGTFDVITSLVSMDRGTLAEEM